MAVTAGGVREIARGRSVSGKLGETNTYTREWLIRVDDPRTSLVDIVNANGVSYFDQHPDDGNCVALEYDCQVADEGGLVYKNTVRYMVPPIQQYESNDPSQIPEDQWSASASTVTGPVTRDAFGNPIVNSAFQPIGGLEREYAELRLTLVRCFSNLGWSPLAASCTNAVNGGGWNGSGPRTWKCHFQSAQKVKENNQGSTIEYWSTTWDFAYRDETWDLREGCEDVGTMEIKAGRRYVIRDKDGMAITQAVALLPNGSVAPEGTPPQIINGGDGVRVYREVDFSVFGAPY